MRIYLSSTYADLVEHRAAVARLLRQMGHEVIGMEEYVAEGARPLERCLRDVDSAAVYVGIFAWRFGYALADGPVRRSITEHEYRRAQGKRPLVFLVDPKASWPVSFIDAVSGSAEDAEGVKRLRDELAREWLAGFFSTPEDLARQVGAAIYRREVTDRLETISAAPGLTDSLMFGDSISESTLMSLKHSLLQAPELRVLTVDLKEGSYWWSTRLFFLAAVAGEIAGTRLLVFVERGERFVGVATTATLRDRLAGMNPVLQGFAVQCRLQPLVVQPLGPAMEQRVQLWNSLWAPLQEEQDKSYVAARDLRRWLGEGLLEKAVPQQGESVSAEFLRAIVDWPHPCVPITEAGALRKVVDRAAVADNLARIFVDSLDRVRA